MKMKMKILIVPVTLVAAAMLSASCSISKKSTESDTLILPLSDSTRVTEGSIVYALPRSVFRINAELQHTVTVPGPYARFAGDMLGLQDIVMSETNSWKMTGIDISAWEEADPSEYYVIKSSSVFQTNMLSLKREGLILDLNPSSRAYDADSHAPVGGSEFSFKALDLGSDEYFQLQSDTAYRRVSVDSSFVRIPYIVEKKKMLTVEQMAEKAAKRLMELRDGKHMILTGEANVFPQSDAAIAEMNRLEKELTELFTGKTFTESRSYSFLVIPDKESSGKPIVMFRFSGSEGIMSAGESSGTPVTVNFNPEKKTKDITLITKNDPSVPVKKYDKLFYRVPEVARITVNRGNESLLSTRRLIYQLGEIVQLPANYIIGR